MLQAEQLAKKGYIVTFGVRPTKPETGYGYIKMAGPCSGAHRVECFVEKPNLAKAQEYLLSGQYLWNSGMFALPVGLLLEELATHANGISRLLDAPYEQVVDRFEEMPDISFDYAVMEQGVRVI